MSKPTAVSKEMVCSECGLDWDLHPPNPRRRDCIELLKDHQPVKYFPYWPYVIYNQYCNWGHYGCNIVHQNETYWYQADSTGTWDGTELTNATVTSISPHNDDPDMGVVAQVS